MASVPLHFFYQWTGKNTVVGLFTPINESIWEHLNLVYWPLLLCWGIGYLIFKDKKDLSLTPWVTATFVSILTSMIFIVSWYYVLGGALNIETSLTNIISLFIGVPLAQLLAIHIYKVVTPRKIYLILSLLGFVILAGLFIYFTFNAPDLPLFIPAV